MSYVSLACVLLSPDMGSLLAEPFKKPINKSMFWSLITVIRHSDLVTAYKVSSSAERGTQTDKCYLRELYIGYIPKS